MPEGADLSVLRLTISACMSRSVVHADQKFLPGPIPYGKVFRCVNAHPAQRLWPSFPFLPIRVLRRFARTSKLFKGVFIRDFE
mgnify:CR=1 FL=1